jgi:hypothetical protein
MNVGIGQVKVESQASDEVTRQGSMQSIGLVTEGKLGWLACGAGFGLFHSKIKGQDDLRGFSQSYNLQSLFFDGRLLAQVYAGLSLGLLTRYHYGKGVNFGVGDEHRSFAQSYLAPTLAYRLKAADKTELLLELSRFQDSSDPLRQTSYMAVSIGLIFRSSGN